MNEPTPVLVLMRKASDPALADSTYGFKCRVCGEALACSPTGTEMMKKPGALALCNTCGAEIIEGLGPAKIGDVGVTPRAAAAILRLGGPNLDAVDRECIDDFYDRAQSGKSKP